ncbi:MAG: HlyD family efflux transporter periplasmic adaptor subunit [Phenylobacterium sp.]|nr:MAG: HlyD family efflux transporter periplasmic adaptor subunit [Phenylobacterium sp.]
MDKPVAQPQARRRRRRLIAGGAGALALIAVAAAIWLGPTSGSIVLNRSEVEIAAVRRAPFEDYLPLRATVAPLTSTFVAAVEGGQVAQVLAQDGQEVAAGAPLARLANPQLTLDVTSREAEISGRLGDASGQELALQQAAAAREAEVADTTYKLLTAKRDLEKHERLHAAGLEADAAVRPFTDEVAYETERLATLRRQLADESALRQAQADQIRKTAARLGSNLDVVQSSLGALTLRAPTAGRLTNFTLQPGQPLKAGDTVGQVDTEGAYKLLAEIDEFYLGRIAPGQTANAQLDGRTVALTVLRVLPQVTDGRFRAELGFVGAPPAGLKRGQSLDLRLTLGGVRPALVLPNGPWIEGSGGAWAFVLTSSGRAERRAITTARRNPEQVEVTRGLAAGDRVVVSSYSGLAPYKHLLLR